MIHPGIKKTQFYQVEAKSRSDKTSFRFNFFFIAIYVENLCVIIIFMVAFFVSAKVHCLLLEVKKSIRKATKKV